MKWVMRQKYFVTEFTIFRYYSIMGTQICSKPSTWSNHVEKSLSLQHHEPSNLIEPSYSGDDELLEEYDNPSRGIQSHQFLKSSVTASNQIMEQLDLRSTGLQKQDEVMKNLFTDYKLPSSIYHIESSELSIGKDAWDEVFGEDYLEEGSQTSETDQQNQEDAQSTRKRKASVQSIIEGQPVQSNDENKTDSGQEILRQISGFMMSQKKIFEPINISKEDFVKFRKEQIEKHYSFVEKIGQGSFGNVFKVFHKASKEFRAIKILKRSAISKLETNKVMREIDILKKLDHPHILKIYEVFFYKSSYYIVTEHCQGGTLSKYVSSQPSSMTITRQIFTQLIAAISYIHKLGIMHRDIKLDNILLKKKVKGDQQEVDIRLIDFGLAKELKGKRMKDTQKIGTHTYMPPEVIQGIYSTKCDMWSVGVVLMMLVSGKNPFKGKSKDETFEKIKSQNIVLKGDRWRQIDKAAKQVVLGLLEKDHRLRLSSQQVLASRWLSGQRQNEKVKEKSILNIVARKFYDYYRQNNFVSIIETYIAYMTTSEKDLKQFSIYFSVLDENKDGLIDPKELKRAFEASSDLFSQAELSYVLNKVESQYEEGLNFTEFVAKLSDRKKLYSRPSLEQAFKYLDNNENGFIQKNQIRKTLKNLDSSQLSYIVSQLDQNNDEKISLEEFISYLQKEEVSVNEQGAYIL